jgi:hypothetical protein
MLEKRKDGKTSFVANNYLEVLVDGEKITFEQLNHLVVQNMIFLGARIPRRCLPIEAIEDETTND